MFFVTLVGWEIVGITERSGDVEMEDFRRKTDWRVLASLDMSRDTNGKEDSFAFKR